MVALDLPRSPDRSPGASGPTPPAGPPTTVDAVRALAQVAEGFIALFGVMHHERIAMDRERLAVDRELVERLQDRTARLDPEQLALDAVEAGRVLGVSKSTVHKMVRQGVLGTVNVGGVNRFSVDDLRAFLTRQRAVRDVAASTHGETTPADPTAMRDAVRELAQAKLGELRAGKRDRSQRGVVDIDAVRHRRARGAGNGGER